jgi:hypothetical protein
MNISELEEFLKSKTLNKPRYYCRIDEMWFVLVVNSKSTEECYGLCLLLDKPIIDAPQVVEFTTIQCEWTLDSNYNSITATSMMRQLDRCLDMSALVSNNLFAIKYNGIKTIAWAKGEIDTSKIFTIAKQNDNFTSTSLVHDKLVALNRFIAMIEANWACNPELIKLQQEFIKRTKKNNVIANTLETLGQYDNIEQEIILVERNFFDICLLKSLEEFYFENLKTLLKNKIF